jgi:hypothetical protein
VTANIIVLWLVAGASLLVALLSWRRGRSLSRRLDELSERYWALSYECGELRVQLQRLTGETAAGPGRAPAPGAQVFVPLKSLKR